MKVLRNLLRLICISITLSSQLFAQNTDGIPKKNGQIYNPDSIEMVYVEGNDKIKGFFIGKYEITQAQWKAVMDYNLSNFQGDSLPVGSVSWNDAQEFISRLNKKTGKNYRLPTETEWEYAAKGGKNNNAYKYSGSYNIDEVAWYKDNSEESTHNVGTKKPNSLGIYDMSGNVWEWCEDWFDANRIHRVLRGGGWYSSEKYCIIPLRGDDSPTTRCSACGLRVLLQ